MRRRLTRTLAAVLAATATGCGRADESVAPRASGYVEATDVRVSAKYPGRVTDIRVVEGAAIKANDVVATISTTDVDLALSRMQAERSQAAAQVRLLEAGARPEDIQQADAQVAAAESEARAAQAELIAASADAQRYEQLLTSRAGSVKQRDDAVARRDLAAARAAAASDRIASARAGAARLRAGARREELDAARARVAAVDAEIATLDEHRRESTVVSPTHGIVTARLVEPGELVAAGAPLAVIVDLDRAWVNAYVEEPLVPALRLDQTVTIVTDDGRRKPGRIGSIAPRAEFTPRNVQTSAERAKLVYRVKVLTDNSDGLLKPGMPVDVELTATR